MYSLKLKADLITLDKVMGGGRKKKRKKYPVPVFLKFWVQFLFTLGQGERISPMALSFQRILN